MSNISAALVNELRKATNIGMMDCKKALVEAEGDKDKALKILKEKGMMVANKRAGKETNEGRIHAEATDRKGYMIQVVCETDFVAKGDNFTNLVQELASGYKNEGESFLSSQKTTDLINEVGGKCGEKISVKNHSTLTNDNGLVFSYLHSNQKVGVLVSINANDNSKKSDDLVEFGKDITMQIAAMSPLALSIDNITESDREEQKEIFLKQMEDDKKPLEIKEKIIKGKLSKHFSEQCLLEMEFVKDSKLKIIDLQKKYQKKLADDSIEIINFKRFQIGN